MNCVRLSVGSVFYNTAAVHNPKHCPSDQACPISVNEICGNTQIKNNAINIPTKYGIVRRSNGISFTLATSLITNKHRPKGGVTIPIARFVIIITPK